MNNEHDVRKSRGPMHTPQEIPLYNQDRLREQRTTFLHWCGVSTVRGILLNALMEEKPSLTFTKLHESGGLKLLLPEVDCLWGVPQRAEYHPEVDTGTHLMMVLDMAARLDTSLDVRFACLTHDMGKGTTPVDVLPKHIGHEQRSADLLKDVVKRLGIDEEMTSLADVVALEHGNIHRSLELGASAVYRLLVRCDAFNQPDRFDKVLLACECDMRGRLGYEEAEYPQATRLKRLLNAGLEVEQIHSEIVPAIQVQIALDANNALKAEEDVLRNCIMHDLYRDLFANPNRYGTPDKNGLIPREKLFTQRSNRNFQKVSMWYTVDGVTSRFYYYTDVYGAFCETIREKLPGVAAVPCSSGLGFHVVPRPGLESGYIGTIAEYEFIHESDAVYIGSVDALVDVLVKASALNLEKD